MGTHRRHLANTIKLSVLDGYAGCRCHYCNNLFVTVGHTVNLFRFLLASLTSFRPLLGFLRLQNDNVSKVVLSSSCFIASHRDIVQSVADFRMDQICRGFFSMERFFLVLLSE